MAARAIWKGIIEFDGVSMPVKLYSAVEDHSIHFNLLHDQDMARLRQRMVNAATGEQVELAQAKKGYEVEPGRFVLVKKDELESLEPGESRSITIEQFVDPDAVSHAFYDRPYFVGPDGSTDQYFALVEALKKQKKTGIARWVMRKKQYAGALRVAGDALMLETLRSPAEVVRDQDIKAPGGRKLEARELKMAEQLISALEGDFDPSDYHNDYVERVRDLVERKAKGQRIELPKAKPPKVKKESLEAMLKASIDAAKKREKSKKNREKAHA